MGDTQNEQRVAPGIVTNGDKNTVQDTAARPMECVNYVFVTFAKMNRRRVSREDVDFVEQFLLQPRLEQSNIRMGITGDD
ncbi:MAG TPA: hypothetical protein VFC78_03725 [Tepidisphaeraceae bacterium]|nr:hypothetical protein [Tepidisphaeraceae bacterium]